MDSTWKPQHLAFPGNLGFARAMVSPRLPLQSRCCASVAGAKKPKNPKQSDRVLWVSSQFRRFSCGRGFIAMWPPTPAADVRFEDR